MTKYSFNSVLAPYIKGLLDQKRALGFKYETEEYFLSKFDIYWKDKNGDLDIITLESLSEWLKQRPTEGKSTQSIRISVVKQLSIYMNGIGKKSYIPMDRIRRPRPVVHILTITEIIDLFHVIDNFKPRKQSPEVTRMADGYRLIFRLILTTGLRRGEAVSIRICDINWENNSIIIRNGKGHKDRTVFMASDLSELIKDYVDQNLSHFSTEWVFPSFNPSRHFSGGALAIRFRSFWKETRFASDTVKAPTIHSLRHTYVVIRMNEWMLQGVDLNVMLPYLSKALGHKSFKETFYYYHHVVEAFRLIQDKDSLAETVFPEVRVR